MEKYGEIPKRFTKEWWSYFWEYYKWHVIITVFAIAMISITAVQLISKTDYDEIVTYIGKADYSDTSVDELSAELSGAIPDVNGNGSSDVLFQVIQSSESASGAENPQYVAAFETKKNVELQMGDGIVFLMDKTQADKLVEFEMESIFIPVEEWYSEYTQGCSYNEYFIKLESNVFFEKYGFETEDVYIGVRALRNDEKNESDKKRLDGGINIAEYLLLKTTEENS